MSVLGCGFCGYGIHYHGEPEGKYPVEHYFCTLEKWRELEEENLPADSIEVEHKYPLTKSWRCRRCGSFLFFSDGIHLSGVYTPKDEFSFAPMEEPFEFGVFWDDFEWFDITENSTPASEVLARYPQTRWFEKNADELRFYSDAARTNCLAQFRRLQVITPVTVQTMSLDSFKKMLARWDDVEFFYRKVYYNFMREDDGINIYRGHGFQKIVYHAARTTDVDEIINAPILQDGKSIAEAQAEIEL